MRTVKGGPVKKHDCGPGRAERLLEQIRPVLLEILRNAPPYGTCGFKVTMHEGRATYVKEKRGAVHKIARGFADE